VAGGDPLIWWAQAVGGVRVQHRGTPAGQLRQAVDGTALQLIELLLGGAQRPPGLFQVLLRFDDLALHGRQVPLGGFGPDLQLLPGMSLILQQININ
jgi:hypothetical protein